VKDLHEDGEKTLVSMRAAKFFTVCVRVECLRKSFSTECVVVMVQICLHTRLHCSLILPHLKQILIIITDPFWPNQVTFY